MKPALFESVLTIYVHVNIFRNLVTINRQPDSWVPVFFLVQMSCTSIENFLVATLVRKDVIQLNTVFLGKEITFYITENNNLSLQYMMGISNNMKADINTKLLRSIFLFCSYWVVEVSVSFFSISNSILDLSQYFAFVNTWLLGCSLLSHKCWYRLNVIYTYILIYLSITINVDTKIFSQYCIVLPVLTDIPDAFCLNHESKYFNAAKTISAVSNCYSDVINSTRRLMLYSWNERFRVQV